jgi:hypothetical protein
MRFWSKKSTDTVSNMGTIAMPGVRLLHEPECRRVGKTTPNTPINIGLGYQISFNGQFTGISGQINARVGF